ncbi:hypothetical protein BCR33DRAFT_447002 [Rhizoclosmatium globosum]|uniref:DNA helicase Pif1-like 2B domain-containing protein n=1 Tax=Rhizoclosmatium globosum TaxID=329046 RepID=A0A1Y2BSG3_9FUNG|nr:hypothetical protein BCR33DRAFT_447002 [Rhizoclosmatium globosum]|eukprot:ORY37577.1 hypothetical protein BCR33DRAFT_447002 [Rhizoclosmatium globosum]
MKPVQLFPTREQVTRFNQENLERLDGTQFGFVAGISGSTVEDRETFVENAMAPFILNLKIGAEVMLLKNLTEDLVNGSRGRVVSVNLPEKAVTVDFCVKRETTTEMIRKELKAETWTYVNPSTKAEVNYVQVAAFVFLLALTLSFQIPLMLSYSMYVFI